MVNAYILFLEYGKSNLKLRLTTLHEFRIAIIKKLLSFSTEKSKNVDADNDEFCRLNGSHFIEKILYENKQKF